MRFSPKAALLGSLALLLASCASDPGLGPEVSVAGAAPRNSSHLPAIRISEVHYDNAGTDAGEAIEISGPAGASVEGWSVVLYNGSNGAVYNTRTLTGTIPATCGPRGVVVLDYPVNGLQNGDPDGFALVNAAGAVVEFLSHEGTFTAVGGPANGLVSTDIGVAETASTPVGFSLQRTGAGPWNAPAQNTFGACNDDQEGPPPPPVARVVVSPEAATAAPGATQAFTAEAFDAADQPIAGAALTWTSETPAVATVSPLGVATAVAEGETRIIVTAASGVADTARLTVEEPATGPLPPVRFSEIHYDNVGTDTGEAIEVEGPAGTDLTGWSVVLYNGNGGASYSTRALEGTIANQCAGRGTVVLTYPQDGIQNGSPDGFALVNAAGTVVEFLSYEGPMTATNGPAAGLAATDIGVAETNAPIGQSLQRAADGTWGGPRAASFGACNGSGTGGPGGNVITFSGRTPNDPPLPVGFQDQLFATVRDGSGAVVQTTVTWTSETPAVATIDAAGVLTALAAGSATIRATTADGATTATYVLPTRVAVASASARYAGNAEFGEPADGSPADDIILRRAQFTASWNPARGTPNWVSYNLEATHFGAEDRCDCFTFDPELPANLPRYTTNDYTGSGAVAGYGIDRGHLARSFDRTAGSLDNAVSFYFTNIIPQAADLNQGPWAAHENYLGNLARFENREVYIITGVAGNKGTLKNEGKVVIPAQVWKVAVILPRDAGLADVRGLDDLVVNAVIMPNDPGVRNVDWRTYETTVDAVEALSGYDLLALLRDDIERAVEAGQRAPVARLDGPYASAEGASVQLSAAASTDADGDALTYAWSFGDGATAAGVTASHVWTQDGTYEVRLVVTDAFGLADTVTTTATVANVAPAIAPVAGATLLPGETYRAAGSFTDPGADSWTATVDYGDGTGTGALPLAGFAFALEHTYLAAGSFTVTVAVADDDVTAQRTATVVVLSPAAAVQRALVLADELAAAAGLNAGEANALAAKLRAALASLQRGSEQAASGQLGALVNQLDALVQSGRATIAQAEPLRVLASRVIVSITR